MKRLLILSVLIGAVIGLIWTQDEDGLVIGAVLGPVLMAIAGFLAFAFGYGRAFGRAAQTKPSAYIDINPHNR